MTRFLQQAGAACLMAATLIAGSETAARDLKFNGWVPPTHPLNTMSIFPWAKEVEAVTQGRVKIVFTPTSVVPPPTQFDAVQSGAVDLAQNIPGFTPARFKAGMIAELPFLTRDAEPLSVALWRTQERYLQQANEYKGVKLLARYAGAPGYVLSPSKAMRSIEDWKGVKLFCGLRYTCEIAEKFGATPVARPGPEVAETIERKIVDAAFIDASGYKSFRLDRFIKYAMLAPKGFYAPTFYLIMNQKAWDEISPADQKAIETISGEALARKVGSDWDKEAAESFKLMREKNVEVVMAEGKYWDELQQTIIPWAEGNYLKTSAEVGVDGKAALAFLREEIAKETRK